MATQERMRGFAMLSSGKTGWIEAPVPTLDPLGAILRPRVVAPCTSDIHTMEGGAGEKRNRILGHEAIAEVMEVGALVQGIHPGELVLVPSATPDWLSLGVQNPKSNGHDHGLMGSFKFLAEKDGVFAERFHVNHADANLCRLPPDVSPEAALLCVDMMSTGLHGVELCEVGFGDSVVVIGIGPVGLMAVAGAVLHGAGQVIAIGTRPACVSLAQDYGATQVLSYREGDLVKQVRALTGGGADCVILAGGGAETFTQAVRMAGPMGVVANINFFDIKDTLTLPALSWGFGMSNKDIRSGFCPGGARRMQKMLALVQNGRIDPTKLITHRFDGFEQIETAFRLMQEKPADLIKPVVFLDWT